MVVSLEASDCERDDALSTLTSLIKAFSRVKEAGSKEVYDKLSKLFQKLCWANEYKLRKGDRSY